MPPSENLGKPAIEVTREELPDLRFTTAEKARDFLIARGMLNPSHAVIENGWSVKDARADLPGWTLTERTEDGNIKLSKQACDQGKSHSEMPTDLTEALEYIQGVRVKARRDETGRPLPGGTPEA